jgi:hypothetical protein
MPDDQSKRIAAAARELGFTDPVLRPGGHYSVTHRDTGQQVFFAATPSDHRAADNTVSQLERVAGRRLPRQRGYAGGKRAAPARVSLLHGWSADELEDSRKRSEAQGRIRELDDEIRDRVELVGLGRLPDDESTRGGVRALLAARDVEADVLDDLSCPVPDLDIPGLDALLSEAPDSVPADPAALDRLRRRFA